MGLMIVVATVGILLILIVLWDAFETVVLPRRVTRRLRLARLFYRTLWRAWSAVARQMRDGNRRESYLSLFGPLSLILLLILWATILVIGFAMLQWGPWATSPRTHFLLVVRLTTLKEAKCLGSSGPVHWLEV